jgi:RNA recognition motif-containing protein
MDTSNTSASPAPSRSVLVENISPSATDKTVGDFFSFCGKITKLYMKKQEGGESSAIVEFETEAASRTALLLTNALIVDRPITVSLYTGAVQSDFDAGAKQDLGKEVPQENITQHDFKVPDEERSKTSVVASLLAAGYILGKDSLQKAQDFDEKHHLTSKAKDALEQIKGKAQEFDQSYKISSTIQSTAHQLDEKYNISEKVTTAAQIAKTQAEKLALKAAENPTIQKGISTVSSAYQNVKNQITTTYTDYKQQVQQEIEKQNKGVGSSKESSQQAPAEQSSSQQSEQPPASQQPPAEQSSSQPPAQQQQEAPSPQQPATSNPQQSSDPMQIESTTNTQQQQQ